MPPPREDAPVGSPFWVFIGILGAVIFLVGFLISIAIKSSDAFDSASSSSSYSDSFIMTGASPAIVLAPALYGPALYGPALYGPDPATVAAPASSFVNRAEPPGFAAEDQWKSRSKNGVVGVPLVNDLVKQEQVRQQKKAIELFSSEAGQKSSILFPDRIARKQMTGTTVVAAAAPVGEPRRAVRRTPSTLVPKTVEAPIQKPLVVFSKTQLDGLIDGLIERISNAPAIQSVSAPAEIHPPAEIPVVPPVIVDEPKPKSEEILKPSPVDAIPPTEPKFLSGGFQRVRMADHEMDRPRNQPFEMRRKDHNFKS